MFLGSCNHVAGLLFRVEAAVLLGVTHSTCTSKLALWTIPSKKKTIQPGKLSSFFIKQDRYDKKVLKETVEQAKVKAIRKLDYVPMTESGKKFISHPKKVRE